MKANYYFVTSCKDGKTYKSELKTARQAVILMNVSKDIISDSEILELSGIVSQSLYKLGEELPKRVILQSLK